MPPHLIHLSPHQKSECSILFPHSKYENNYEHPLKNYRLPVSHDVKIGHPPTSYQKTRLQQYLPSIESVGQMFQKKHKSITKNTFFVARYHIKHDLCK